MTKKTLLLAEDDLFLREMYVDLLQEVFQVDSAQDGEEALSKLKNQQYDIVLMDIVMPKLGGFDVVKKIKDDQSVSQPKALLFLSNVDEPKVQQEAQSLGNGYLLKSMIEPSKLAETVEKYIS